MKAKDTKKEKAADAKANSLPSALDLLRKRTAFIGSAKGLPRDSSTNPKYMEGFGKNRR